jgi:predicted transcriptional regulator
VITHIEEIAKIRKSLSMTQNQLAKISGISQSAIAKIESKKMEPSFSLIKKISSALESKKEKSSLKAKNIMHTPVTSIKFSESIDSIIKIMKKKGYSQLPVEQEGKIIGTITESALLDAITQGKKKAYEVMLDAPPIISKETNLEAIAGMLKHFPMLLVSENGKIKGVITKSDLLSNI